MSESLKFIKSFIHSLKEKNVKHYLTCTNIAAQQACLDNGDGIIIIERYCGECARKVIKPKGR